MPSSNSSSDNLGKWFFVVVPPYSSLMFSVTRQVVGLTALKS